LPFQAEYVKASRQARDATDRERWATVRDGMPFTVIGYTRLLTEFKRALQAAIDNRRMFSPEGLQFIENAHSELRDLMDELENGAGETESDSLPFARPH